MELVSKYLCLIFKSVNIVFGVKEKKESIKNSKGKE